MPVRPWLALVVLVPGCFDPEPPLRIGLGADGSTGTDAECIAGERHCACDLVEHCADGLDCIDGLCVAPGDPSGDGSTDTSSSGGEPGDDEDACPVCDATPMPCHAAPICVDGSCRQQIFDPGTTCELGDPCVVEAACNAVGQCVAVTRVTPTAPPTECEVGPGACDRGVWVYELREAGAACEDGDPCTPMDTCDGAGTCVPDEVCPTDNPCMPGQCIVDEATCIFVIEAEGTSCGPQPSEVCCEGVCVDTMTVPGSCG